MGRTSMSVLAGLLMGMLVMAALPSMAANDDPIYLGQKNTARKITKVRTRNGVLFETTIGGVPAATFNVVSGAPIAVNSNTLVTKLNADRLDGKHSYQLHVQSDFRSNDNLPDAQNWSTTIQIHIPAGGGAAVMSGGVGWYNNTGGDYEAACKFQVDAVDVSGSFRADEANNGESSTCTSEALKQLTSGFHNVTFTTFAMGTAGIQLNEGFWYVMVLPG